MKTYPERKDINENRKIVLPFASVFHTLEWKRYAACAGAGADLFHTPKREAECLEVCHRCSVIEQCRSMADDVECNEIDRHCVVGVYGGETPKQRIERRQHV